MIQLRPTETFTIVRVLGDTVDTSTYYVQAVIRNSKTGATIDTVNLTDQGSRRFTGDWEVSADVGGEGFYIDITTTVYTDSGYSTNAGDYAEEVTSFLIQDRYNRTFGLGGGVDIDYKKVRKIIQDEIKTIIIPIPEKVNLSSLEAGVQRVISQIINIKFPQQKETDLSGVMVEIANTKNAIDNKHIPEPEKVDLTPILAKNLDIEKIINNVLTEMKVGNKEVVNVFNKFKKQKIKFDLTNKLKDKINNFFISPDDLVIKEEITEVVKEKKKRNRPFLRKL